MRFISFFCATLLVAANLTSVAQAQEDSFLESIKVDEAPPNLEGKNIPLKSFVSEDVTRQIPVTMNLRIMDNRFVAFFVKDGQVIEPPFSELILHYDARAEPKETTVARVSGDNAAYLYSPRFIRGNWFEILLVLKEPQTAEAKTLVTEDGYAPLGLHIMEKIR